VTVQNVQIRPPEPTDAAALEALITAHFSEGASYGVDLAIDDPTRHVRVAADDEPVGVMAVNRFDERDPIGEEMYFFDDPEGIPPADQYGLVEMGYVRADATGRGIGSRLLETIEAIGLDHGVDCFVIDSWYHGGPDSPRNLFVPAGYETVRTTPIERPAAECPKCTDTCTCEGALGVWLPEE
jgi:Acetyltransferase (GNAT) family.